MFDLVTDTYQDFINFLVKRNVLDVGIAFIVSSQITKLSNNFIDNIITPVLNGMFGNKNTTFDEIILHIGDANIEIGKFISSILKFILMMFILFFFFTKLLPSTNK
jgi:large conductance mechanosensitive channel